MAISTRALLLPVSSSQRSQCCYEGYVTAKGGLEYHIKLTIPSKSLKDARLECDWKLGNLLRGQEALVQKRLAESSDLDQFLLELKTIIQRQECVSWLSSGDALPSASYTKLLADLDELGWARVVHVSADLTSLKLSARDRQSREHVMTLSISSQGPEGTLLGLVGQFERWLTRFEVLWGVLDEVDHQCWVLEPERPNRACTHRRVVIGDNLSLHMLLEPLSPTTAPQLTFLGADHDVNPLMSKWNSSLDNWQEMLPLLENLQNILPISFPPAPGGSDQEEGEECAICYAYRWEGHAPSVVCGNRRCRQVFHNQCLYEWLRSLQTVTKYFNKVTGECPNCGQLISSTASS